MTGPTPEAYEAAAIAQVLARVPEPSMGADELTAFVREYLIDDNLRAAVDAVWLLAQQAKAAEILGVVRDQRDRPAVEDTRESILARIEQEIRAKVAAEIRAFAASTHEVSMRYPDGSLDRATLSVAAAAHEGIAALIEAGTKGGA